MTEHAPNSNFTTEKETRKVVTPFAFKVHDSLLGQRLATPRRRLAAIVFDLLIIAMLTRLPGIWLSGLILCVVVYSLYQLKSSDAQTGAKVGLYAVGVLTVLTIVVQVTLTSFWGDKEVDLVVSDEVSIKASPETGPEPLVYRSRVIDDAPSFVISDLKSREGEVACEIDQACAAPFFNALIDVLVEEDLSYEDASLTYADVRDFLASEDRLDGELNDTTLSQQLYQQRLSGALESSREAGLGSSVLAWAQGVLGDLGLSFGWAAVYFSVLTSWWNGQTIGKRLFGIKVVRIDAKPINLWESIGRYGGYSAGLGTGLLGFLQLYWDANRQAIQDKISETLVIRP